MEKLDKLVRFCIKEKVLSLEDLDRIWNAQDGKHEVIVKNIHDMLVKLAWDFSPEQLDYLFGCFQVCVCVCVCTCACVHAYMRACVCVLVKGEGLFVRICGHLSFCLLLLLPPPLPHAAELGWSDQEAAR